MSVEGSTVTVSPVSLVKVQMYDHRVVSEGLCGSFVQNLLTKLDFEDESQKSCSYWLLHKHYTN